MFNNGSYIITDNQTKNHVITIPRSRNNMFPLDVFSIRRLNVVVVSSSTAELWHLHLGHLSYRSLMYISQNKMVFRMPEMKQGSKYEDCVVSKQLRASFPSGMS